MANNSAAYYRKRAIEKREASKELCSAAVTEQGQKRSVDIVACAECESPCKYGMRYLSLCSKKDLVAASCGKNCGKCTAPCNLAEAIHRKKQQEIARFVRTATSPAGR